MTLKKSGKQKVPDFARSSQSQRVTRSKSRQIALCNNDAASSLGNLTQRKNSRKTPDRCRLRKRMVESRCIALPLNKQIRAADAPLHTRTEDHVVPDTLLTSSKPSNSIILKPFSWHDQFSPSADMVSLCSDNDYQEQVSVQEDRQGATPITPLPIQAKVNIEDLFTSSFGRDDSTSLTLTDSFKDDTYSAEEEISVRTTEEPPGYSHSSSVSESVAHMTKYESAVGAAMCEFNSPYASSAIPETNENFHLADIGRFATRFPWIEKAYSDLKRQEEKQAERKRNRRKEHEQMVVEDLATNQAAKLLLPLLTGCIPGCVKEEHERSFAERIMHGNGEIFDLTKTYDGESAFVNCFPDIGLDAERFPHKTNVPREAYPNASILEALFSGCNKGSNGPAHISLEKEQEKVVNVSGPLLPTVRGDTDSLIGGSSTLAVFTERITYCPVYEPIYNIDTNLHFDIPIPRDRDNGARRDTPLRNIHHWFMGTVRAASGRWYICVPNYHSEAGEGNFIQKDHHRLFYDEVWWPACREVLPSSLVANEPETYLCADLNSHAFNREGKKKPSGSKQHISYTLQPQYLSAVWEVCQERVRCSSSLAMFENMFVFFDVKGIKSETDGRDLLESMEAFDDELSSFLDLDLMDSTESFLLLDPASTITPDTPSFGTRHERDIALTLLWRRCCLERIYEYLATNGFDNRKGIHTLYTVGHLKDVACLGVEPPKQSTLYRGGFRYLQAYGQVKNILAANGWYPFGDNDLHGLAVDYRAYQTLAAQAGKSHADRANLESRWCNLKRRLRGVLSTGDCSYGLRIEVRITRPLWIALKQLAKSQSCRKEYVQKNRVPLPGSCLAVRSKDWFRFLRGNFNKYFALIEMCSATSPSTGRSVPRSLLMLGLLETVQSFLNSNLNQHSVLWKTTQQNETGKYWGMGFEHTLNTYGYCWLQRGIINWHGLHFSSMVGDRVINLSNRWLLSWAPSGNSFLEDTSTIPLKLVWYLKKARYQGRLAQNVFKILAHYVLRLYRMYVLSSLRQSNDIRDLYREASMQDQIKFSSTGWRLALKRDIGLLSRNRSGCTSPDDIFTWLWLDDKTDRKGWTIKRSWEDQQFRLETRLISELLKADHSDSLDIWRDILFCEFFTYHTVIPYPNRSSGGIISKVAHEDKRSMWAVTRVKNGTTRDCWQWAKDRPDLSRCSEIPSFLLFRGEELDLFLTSLYLQTIQPG